MCRRYIFALVRYLFPVVLSVVEYVDKLKLGVSRYANVS